MQAWRLRMLPENAAQHLQVENQAIRAAKLDCLERSKLSSGLLRVKTLNLRFAAHSRPTGEGGKQ
jgi:hypothetical protein